MKRSVRIGSMLFLLAALFGAIGLVATMATEDPGG